MDKKEFIEEIKVLKHHVENKSWIDRELVLDLVEQLDEPQKVVIPKLVADWMEYCKNTFLSLARALNVSEEDFHNYANQKDHLDILYFLGSMVNQEKFAKAWLFGYEVEKEKKYLVKFKNIQSGTQYLKYDKVIEKWYFGIEQGTSSSILHNTKDELISGGFGWVFSCEGVEVEEVQDDSKI